MTQPSRPRMWEPGGNELPPQPASPDLSSKSPTTSTVHVTDVKPYFTRQKLAQICVMSTRGLDRAAAMGLLPKPDLVVGRSPRWSPETVFRWLRTRPHLPGRGRKRGKA
jgi:hypothetical protein